MIKPAGKKAGFFLFSKPFSFSYSLSFYCLLAVILLIAPLFASCSAVVASQGPPVDLIKPVEAPADLVPVKRGDIKPVKVAEGIVVPYSEGLGFIATDAPISAIYVNHGQDVSRGELLAELDRTAWLDSLAAARGELDHLVRVSAHEDRIADIELELRQIDVDEADSDLNRELAELGLQEYKNRDMIRRETQALDRDSLQTRIDALESQKDNYSIYAPFDGVILIIESLAIGDYPSGRTPFIYLADLNRLTVRSITEQTSFFTAATTIMAVIGSDEWPVTIVPYTLEEQLAFYYEGITPPARFEFDGGEDGVYGGKVPPADKRVLLMAHEIGVEDVLIIPINAAHIETASDVEGVTSRLDYAYVDIGGARERRDIRCGRRSDVWIEVVEGLSEGELVYVD